MRVMVAHSRYRSAIPSGENQVVDREIAALETLGYDVIRFEQDSDEIEHWPLLKKAALPGRLETFAEPRAVGEQRDLGAFAQDAAFADLERLAFFRHRHAAAFAARIAQRRGPIVDRDRCRHHVHQVGLVGRRHQHEIGQAAEIGDVERTSVGRLKVKRRFLQNR